MARVCDRCGKPARQEVVFSSTSEKFDVCPDCEELTRHTLTTPPAKEPKIDPSFKDDIKKAKKSKKK